MMGTLSSSNTTLGQWGSRGIEGGCAISTFDISELMYNNAAYITLMALCKFDVVDNSEKLPAAAAAR